jgi:hypothetical protein
LAGSGRRGEEGGLHRFFENPLWAEREPQDFDLILMLEVKNMAALDGFRAKEDAALQKVFGSNFEQASKDLTAKRVEMREIYGSKLLREITLK